ncbi:MAG TPA: Glu/Leu/Phe/Val dehydrogenase dimerization domain-containing protein [Actinomycetota bacterium]|jgi:leucine dehydrogenase
MFEELLHAWDGEEVALRFDAASNAWMFVCVHSTVLGPGMGGVRLQRYATPHDALADGLRLAGAMTLKQAAADLPFGGGKAVLAVPDIPRGADRAALFSRYADLVNAMGGTYVTAADMNTGQADMDLVGERTAHVLGRSPERGGSGDPAPSTARGVFHGIVATARRRFGSSDLAGKRALVQGVGAVGFPLAEHLHEAGASVILADPNAERVSALAERLGGTLVAPVDVVGTECEIFAPCATGGILSAETIPKLRCSVVAGAANNQLAAEGADELVRDAGILYAPDFVINAGGVIHLAGYETLGWDEGKMASRLESIGDTLDEVFDAADRDGVTTDAAARRMARSRLDAAG